MTDIRDKIQEVRKEIRNSAFEQQRLLQGQRKTSIILSSIDRYSHEEMMQAIVSFGITIKNIDKLNKDLVKLFNKLYILNVEYSKPELVA